MPRLGVNIDHIATLRQQRRIGIPDIAEAAREASAAGADSITVHLRDDRRHIQDEDVFRLKKIKGLKLNLEMSASKEILKVALKIKPDSVCIVPEKRLELTTEGGLDIQRFFKKLEYTVKQLKRKSIFTSVFLDPVSIQIKAAYNIGADAVELHTGAYACSAGGKQSAVELNKILNASALVRELGMKLHAGHGLNYDNVRPIASIKGMSELNIGFSIVARAIFTGLRGAVSEMKRLVI